MNSNTTMDEDMVTAVGSYLERWHGYSSIVRLISTNAALARISFVYLFKATRT